MPGVRTAAVELAGLLEDSQAPVYVVDDNRSIVFCNRACARWLEIDAGLLVSQRCVYSSQEDGDVAAAIAARLCPPPAALAGKPQAARISRVTPDGRTVYRWARFLPLSDGADESAAVIAVLETSDCLADAPPTSTDVAPAADAAIHEQLRALRQRLADRYAIDSLLGISPAIERARAQVRVAAASDANTLIVGPAGSGKDHVAKAIHYAQSRPAALVPLACAVLEVNLLRSALRAAWSPGTAAQSLPVTLLLNDVDAMPPEAQSDLSELVRQSSRRIRILSTAAQSLDALAAAGKFDAQLACRLTTLSIELPALAGRLEDLPLLAQAFLEECNRSCNKQVGGFSRPALDRLAAYAWPGNLDELSTMVRVVHERATGGEAGISDLPREVQWAAEAGARPARADESIVLEDFLAKVEIELIGRALRRAKNNKSKAAKLLGLTRPKLYRRLEQLGLEPADEGDSPRE